MTTYALLIYRTMPAQAPIPEAELPPVLVGHRVLQAEAAAQRQLHAVARLDEPTTAHTVRVTVSGHEVTDGPFIEAKEWLVGFYLVDCADANQAISRAKQICGDTHHVIEVRPVNWRWKG